MRHKGVLSSAFNMSLGFIPVMITIILCELLTQDMAVYIGTGIGIGYSFYGMKRKGTRVPNFILYISTVMMILLTITAFFSTGCVPPKALPLTLEVAILIPMLILYMHKQRFINYFLIQKGACHRRLFAQGAESAIVSARVVLLLGAIHFSIVSLSILLCNGDINRELSQFIYHILPAVVFALSILLNQIGIHYFNRLMTHTEYVPIVNTQGDVLGKSLAIEALNYKNAYINPVIRIAILVHGRVFLCTRPQTCILDKGKIDYPMECYLHYEETLNEGVQRMIKHTLPRQNDLQPSFNISYHFENKQTNRLIYLFLLELEDDSILCSPRFKNGKLWGFQQIEQNLNMHFFSECFEKEYEHLKSVIDTRERYKVS
ncbi:MAG: hypothetical protein RR365_09580 [Bacteroides sp.]